MSGEPINQPLRFGHDMSCDRERCGVTACGAAGSKPQIRSGMIDASPSGGDWPLPRDVEQARRKRAHYLPVSPSFLCQAVVFVGHRVCGAKLVFARVATPDIADLAVSQKFCRSGGKEQVAA
jgi:hypothetical protein